MYEIYGDTVKNLIWLGEADHTTTTALWMIRKIVRDMRDELGNLGSEPARRGQSTSRKSSFERNSYSTRGMPFGLSSDDTAALTRYYDSEWFHRLWVVQEAVLAPKSSCYKGDFECSLGTVMNAGRWLKWKHYHVPLSLGESLGIDSTSRLFNFYNWDLRPNTTTTLMNILMSTWELNTSNVKDHIFAVLGLVRRFTTPLSDSHAHLLLPDYTKSTAAVFTDAAKYCILETQELSVLHRVSHRSGEPRISDLPSWVPTWGRKIDDDAEPRDMIPSLYQASSTLKIGVGQIGLRSADQVYLQGFEISDVQTCSTLITRELLRRMLRMTISHMIRYSFGATNEPSPALDAQSVLVLAMTATTGLDYRKKRWDSTNVQHALAAYDTVTAANKRVPALEAVAANSSKNDRLAAEFAEAAWKHLRLRRLFTTTGGNIGLGPPTMESGDRVTILFGCRTPVVLRRATTGTYHYQFVGDCYMHGIMDGEALDEHRANGRNDATFILV